jgi:dihydrodipicolinate synthase/N-acetylneuraminate lyase
MKSRKLEGVFPILVTPFDEKGRIDEESLASLVEFNIGAGVHGLGVAIGSEVFKFTEAEREVVTGCVIAATQKRVPVVINTGAGGTDLAVAYSRAAEHAGADALMIMPPAFMPAGPAEVLDYFRAISAAVSIPIFLQDTPAAPISPGLARRLADECEHVRYIKVETLPVTAKVAEMANGAGDKLTVFGGAGGTYFIEELRRGSLGTMPFCSQPAAFVEVWNLWRQGNLRRAREVFDRTIMPVNRLAAQGGDVFYHVHKQLLVRQGVIRSAKVRSPTLFIDDITRQEIDELIAEIHPAAIV